MSEYEGLADQDLFGTDYLVDDIGPPRFSRAFASLSQAVEEHQKRPGSELLGPGRLWKLVMEVRNRRLTALVGHALTEEEWLEVIRISNNVLDPQTDVKPFLERLGIGF